MALGEAFRLDEALRTLDAYFSHPGNISQAAREMHVHPNTFRYRLAKVADLLIDKGKLPRRAFPPSPSFGHLPDDERAAIHEILSATLPNLPAGWGK